MFDNVGLHHVPRAFNILRINCILQNKIFKRLRSFLSVCRVEQLQVMISAACCCKCCMHCTTVRQGRDTGDTVICSYRKILQFTIGDIVIIHGWTNGFSPVKRYTLPDGLKKCQTTGPADIKQGQDHINQSSSLDRQSRIRVDQIAQIKVNLS